MGKINRWVKILFLIIGLLIIVFSSGRIIGYDIFKRDNSHISADLENDKEQILKNIIPDFSYYKYDQQKDYYSLYDPNGIFICGVMFSSPYCDKIKGFGGNIPLIIILDKEEKIKNIVLLDHYESKSWIDELQSLNFFDSWTGLALNEALEENVNAISGATYTSNAVIESVKLRLSIYLEESAKNDKRNLINIIGLISSFMVLAFAVFNFLIPQQSKILRIILLFASVGILGFWQGDFLSIALLHNWLINGLNINLQIFLFVLLIFSVLIPLITNKAFYCQYVCPFGAAQELAGYLNRRKITFGHQITKILRSIKFIFLFIITLLLVVAIDIKLENLEPFPAFKFKFASLSVLILALVMIFLSIFINKPWCRFFCPTGAFLSLLRGKSKKFKHRNFNIQAFLNIILAILVLVLTLLLVKKSQDTGNYNNMNTSNNVLEVIHNRKSVRNYTDQAVSRKQLEDLVRAGMAAPSARNLQPWVFVIVRDRGVLNSLSDSLPYAKMLKNAKAAIVVCGDLSKNDIDIENSYWVQDCSAATQNILLAAESIGLGAVWTALYPYQERIRPVKQYLELPENIIPLNVIPIGYPTGSDKPKDKWKPENIHWEKW